jgi:hypothetical protein
VIARVNVRNGIVTVHTTGTDAMTLVNSLLTSAATDTDTLIVSRVMDSILLIAHWQATDMSRVKDLADTLVVTCGVNGVMVLVMLRLTVAIVVCGVNMKSLGT